MLNIDECPCRNSYGPPEYVQRYATKEAADAATDGNEDEDEVMSEIGSMSEGE